MSKYRERMITAVDAWTNGNITGVELILTITSCVLEWNTKFGIGS